MEGTCTVDSAEGNTTNGFGSALGWLPLSLSSSDVASLELWRPTCLTRCDCLTGENGLEVVGLAGDSTGRDFGNDRKEGGVDGFAVRALSS